MLSTIGFPCTDCWRHKLGWTYWHLRKNPFYLIIVKWISTKRGLILWLLRFSLNSLGEGPLVSRLKAHIPMQYIIKVDLSSDTWRKWNGDKNSPEVMRLFLKNIPTSGCCRRVASCHFQVLMPWLIMKWCLIMYFIMHNKYKLHTWLFITVLKICIIYPWMWKAFFRMGKAVWGIEYGWN